MSFSSCLALAAATVTAAAGTIAAGPPDTGFDRPGGVYTNISTQDAAACAIACAQDRICMSWTFRITEYVGCSLKAVVPPAVADRNAISGIDDRAGEFLSLVSNVPLTPPPARVETAPMALAAAAPPPQPVEPPAEKTPELLGAPASLSSAIDSIAPTNLHPAALLRGPAPDIRPILEISAPILLQGAAPVSKPTLQTIALRREPLRENAALMMPAEPEPEPLGVPTTLTARFTALTRVAYRAPTVPARPAPAFAPLVIEEPAPDPLGAPSTLTPQRPMLSRVAYRAPIVMARPAPELKPLVIEEPSPQAATLALNDRVVVGLPSTSAEQPSTGVVPVAYVAPEAAPAAPTSAPEDELLGAP